MELNGASGPEVDIFEAQWVKKHKLVTFDEAVEAHIKAEGGDASEYLAKTQQDRNMSLSKRRKLSSQNFWP